MSRLRIGVQVFGAKEVTDDIEDAVEQGISEARAGIALNAERVAKARIREVGAIWKGDLIESFDTLVFDTGDTYYVWLYNSSGHAAPIEFGAEYEEKGPPVAALIPWVRTKLSGYNVPEDELPDPDDLPDIRKKAKDEAINQTTIDVVDMASKQVISQAFWLQQHIKEHGIDAVRFMRAAEKWAEEDADRTAAQYISMELKKL